MFLVRSTCQVYVGCCTIGFFKCETDGCAIINCIDNEIGIARCDICIVIDPGDLPSPLNSGETGRGGFLNKTYPQISFCAEEYIDAEVTRGARTDIVPFLLFGRKTPAIYRLAESGFGTIGPDSCHDLVRVSIGTAIERSRYL